MDKTLHEQHGETPVIPAVLGRRRMLGGAAVAGVGLVGLTACGSGSSSPGTGGGGSDSAAGEVTSSSGGSAAGGQTAVTVPVDEVPVGGGKILAKQAVVVTQPSAGVFKAFSAVCTHQGCIVAQIKDKMIGCPCHGSEFSITDGSVLNGPATTPLPAKTVTKKGLDLTVT
ncbi:Rieske (2Fe-2S) protein [Dermatophilaceae bacterium Sec6.4]